MFNNLTSLAYGLITFAVVIGIGVVVLTQFGGAIATCATGYTYNITQDQCLNATGGDPTDPSNAGWSNTHYLNTQMGSSGLAGWAPAIIALSVGMLFLGLFLSKKGRVRKA